MTAKEWLNRGFKINAEIKLLEKELETAETLATGVVKPTNAEQIQSSVNNSTERNFVRCAEYALLLKNKRDELLAIKSEIFKAISAVDNTVLRTLLFARYIRFEKWEDVAEDIGYGSIRWVRTALHHRALEAIKNFIILP